MSDIPIIRKVPVTLMKQIADRVNAEHYEQAVGVALVFYTCKRCFGLVTVSGVWDPNTPNEAAAELATRNFRKHDEWHRKLDEIQSAVYNGRMGRQR